MLLPDIDDIYIEIIKFLPLNDIYNFYKSQVGIFIIQ